VALGKLYSDYNSVTPEILQALAKRYFVKDRAWKLVVAPQPANADAASSR
jgi:predicted Zn-dependent peptidase